MKECYLAGKNRIYYRKNDFLKKQTIVFVHGASGGSSAWIPYEKKFEKKFNVLSFDIRGHGKSFRPKTFNEYAINHFSKDVHRVIKKEKIKDFILVGHSFGSMIVLDFVKNYQNLVKSLILISSDAAPKKRLISKVMKRILSFSKIMNYFPQYKTGGGHIEYGKFIGTGDFNIKRLVADIKNTGFRSYSFSMLHAYDFNCEDFLPKIKIPVLIIHGNKDTICPLNTGVKIKNAIKNSKMIIFDGSNHVIVLNDIERLAKEIDKFVTSLSKKQCATTH